MQRTGKSMKDTVNNLLRFALNARKGRSARRNFVVEARDLGDTRPGICLTNVGELLDRLEPPVAI